MDNFLRLSVTSTTHAKPIIEKRYFAWGEIVYNAE